MDSSGFTAVFPLTGKQRGTVYHNALAAAHAVLQSTAQAPSRATKFGEFRHVIVVFIRVKESGASDDPGSFMPAVFRLVRQYQGNLAR